MQRCEVCFQNIELPKQYLFLKPSCPVCGCKYQLTANGYWQLATIVNSTSLKTRCKMFFRSLIFPITPELKQD